MSADRYVYEYGRAIAMFENAVVVISDMAHKSSSIFSGLYGRFFGLDDYFEETSIWEKKILSHMSENEQDAKFLAELRFLHYLKKLPRRLRSSRYLATRLRMTDINNNVKDTLHRMFYIYDHENMAIRYAVCIYEPYTFDFIGKSVIVDSTTGNIEELTDNSDKNILSVRETQVLSLIERGNTSEEIAGILSISKNTVSRHRQDILERLHVKNSLEACRLAKSLGII